MIGEKGVGFKVFEKMKIKKKLEDFRDSRSKGYRRIVGGIRMVTLLRNRLNQGMLPRFRVGGGFEYETKKTAKHWRQLNRKFLQEPRWDSVRARCLVRLQR
ncbi:MAG: hypothetical protein AAFW00_28990 [Bacteroidota bacterium]